MGAVITAPTGKPDAFKFVARGNISADRRDAINAAAARIGVDHVALWSGAEFEENLRLRAEDLLQRFCAGEPFPDSGDDIRHFVADFAGLSDNEALRMMAAVFDRPAFRTPFHQENSIPAFLQAIEDTISALNTGLWRRRDGADIRRIRSVHHLRDPRVQAKVKRTVQLVDELRRTFVSGKRSGKIRPCGCGRPDCPVFTLTQELAVELDRIRSRALDAFREADHGFDVKVV
jgi:hypothetical protein